MAYHDPSYGCPGCGAAYNMSADAYGCGYPLADCPEMMAEAESEPTEWEQLRDRAADLEFMEVLESAAGNEALAGLAFECARACKRQMVMVAAVVANQQAMGTPLENDLPF